MVDNRKKQKIAFVIPWYGPTIPGGAETLCREWAEHLTRANFDVEVLTTTIRQFQSDWNTSHHKPGMTLENGVKVRRFELRRGDHELFNSINKRILLGLNISREEEASFLRESANSDALIQFIESHKEEYRFLFIPYLYGTTYYGLKTAQERSILVPCLHDEAYARMEHFRECFSHVPAFMFNSHPEQVLAGELYDIDLARQIVLGMGMEGIPVTEAQQFRAKFKQQNPFLLYVGRRDSTKNTDLLIAYFQQFKKDHPQMPLDLVLIGSGDIDCSDPAIRDLGFLDAQDKYNAFAAAEVFCNPSTNESFSIVLMEAWLCGSPALVHAQSPPMRDFVQRSRGGLFFGDYYEFEACLLHLLNNRDDARSLALNGRLFVNEHFTWPVLISRFAEWIAALPDESRSRSQEGL